MRRALLLFSLSWIGCDKPPPPPPPVVTAPAPSASAPNAAASVEMPERPVPRTSPTVGSGMSPEVQMKAIGYMNAMVQPHPDDPNADPEYAAQLAITLKPMSMSLDKGSAADKQRLNRVDVVGGGRKIDLYMAAGCEGETPAHVAQNAGIPLSTLRSRGVLVIRCNDARAQCLQSTRDPSDILCTTAPRHK